MVANCAPKCQSSAKLVAYVRLNQTGPKYDKPVFDTSHKIEQRIFALCIFFLFHPTFVSHSVNMYSPSDSCSYCEKNNNKKKRDRFGLHIKLQNLHFWIGANPGSSKSCNSTADPGLKNRANLH